MKIPTAFAIALLWSTLAAAQDRFTVTGTVIPAFLLTRNYGSMPKGIVGYDLTICNATDQEQSVINTQAYQALAASTSQIVPVGSQLLLAQMLGAERKDVLSLATFGLNTAAGMFALLSTSRKLNAPTGVKTGVGLASIALPQFMDYLQSARPADKLQKYEADVLPQALVLDSRSCVEKTLFAVATSPHIKPAAIAFHIK